METTLTGENITGGLQHAYDLQMWFTTPICSSSVHPGEKKKAEKLYRQDANSSLCYHEKKSVSSEDQ